MNIKLRQIEVFVAVASTGSFADACDRVHLSQPAISAAIKNLEREVGGKLLARSTRSVELTPEGRAFYPVARQLLADYTRSLDDLSNLFRLQRGKLEIAAMPSFAGSLLPDLLATFHHHYPGINITVHDVIAEVVVEMVQQHRVELGISFDPGEVEGTAFTPLFRDRFMLVVPSEHPLAGTTSVSWHDLAGHTLIALQKPSSIRLMIDRVLEQHKIALSPTFEAHQLVVVGRMVAAGLGVAVVPELSRHQMQELGAHCLPITPEVTRPVGLIRHARHPMSTASSAMMDIVVSHFST